MLLRFIKVLDNTSKVQSLKGLTSNKKKFLRECSLDEIEKYNKSINDSNPFGGNGIYFTGKQPDGSFLLVIDFDKNCEGDDERFEKFVAECIKKLEIPKENLYIVKSGGGGYHFYFEVIGKPEDVIFKTKNFIFLNDMKEYVKSVDFLADEGLVFAPGSDFRNQDNGKSRPHENIYEIISENSEIPIVQFDSVVNLMLFIDEMNKIKLIEDKPVDILDDNPNLTVDEVDFIYSLPIRAAFKFILSGRIQITNEEFDELATDDGKAKFRIWIAFFRELFIKVPNFEENIEIFYQILAKTQSEFDLNKTKQNVHQAKGKAPITKHIYDKYFGKWQEMLDKEESRVKELKKESQKLWIKQIAERSMNSPYFIGYLKENKEFFYFNGKVYELNTDKVKSIIIDMILESGKTGTKHEVAEVLAYIQAKNHHFLKEFDVNESYLIFDNGIYDLETRSLLDFNAGYLAFKKFKYAYDPNVRDLPDKTNRYIQRLGWTREEIERFLYISKAIVENKLPKLKLFVVCWGVPDSGKTLWGEKIANLIGEPNLDWCLLRFEKFQSRFALEQTQFAKFVILDDVSVNAMENSQIYAIFKNLTSGTTYELEGKGKSAITQPIKFSIYISCNMLFRLPQREEVGALLNRAYIFEFNQTHKKEIGFANVFLNDKEDNEKLLSYLVNLDEKPILEYSRIPYREDLKNLTPLEYWFKNSDAIFYLCSTYLRKDRQNKVNLTSVLQILQAAANKRKLNVDVFSKQSIDEIKNFCKKNLDAMIPRAKLDLNGEYQTWMFGVFCFGAINESITVADNIENVNISQIDELVMKYEKETEDLLYEKLLELKKSGTDSVSLNEITTLIERDLNKAIESLKNKNVILKVENGLIAF